MQRDIHFKFDLGKDCSVARARVCIFAITDGAPRRIDERVTTGSRFAVPVPTDGAEYFYAVARLESVEQGGEVTELGDRSVQLVSTFDAEAKCVALSERVSVATVYSFARFMEVEDDGRVVISDPDQAAKIAYGMKNNFVATDGALSKVLQTPPNGMQSNSYAMFNFLANLVYYALVDASVYGELIRLTRSQSLLAGLLRLPYDPYLEVEAIYGLIADREQIYQPSLPSLRPPATPLPNQWTLTIKVNDSGAENFLIAGVGYADFDKNDRLWLTNNVRQGTPNSSTFCVILESDGSPAPFSPLFGGGQLGAGFGVAADQRGETIYFGNFGWGPTEWNPQAGSVSAYRCDGTVLSPPNGFTAGLSRVQGMNVDRRGNLWMASWGSQQPMPWTPSKYDFTGENSAVVVYLDADPERVLVHSFDSPNHLTFDVAFDEEGDAYVSNSGYGGNQDLGIDPVPSSVYKLRIEDGKLRVLARWVSQKGYEALRQIVVRPGGDVLIGAVKSNRVICLDPQNLRFRGQLTDDIHGPWGLTLDRDGTLFVANFLREMEAEIPTAETLGPHSVTVVRQGHEHPARLMTLPTGGHEVTLANGQPLYGAPETQKGKEIPLHSFDPLMRLTATRIDRAGNLWACNNWKPSAEIDVVRGNPGGDGMVVFVGVAAPAQRSYQQ